MDGLQRKCGSVSQIIISEKCRSLVNFSSLCRLFPNCTRISVDMRSNEKVHGRSSRHRRFPWRSEFLLALCDQLILIERQKRNKLSEIVLRGIKKKRLAERVWARI